MAPTPGSDDTGVEVAPAASPALPEENSDAATQLDELFNELAPDSSRLNLDKLRKETNAKRRMDLLRSMAKEHDLVEIRSLFEPVKMNFDSIERVHLNEAIEAFTHGLVFLLPQLLLRSSDIQLNNVESVLKVLDRSDDPFDAEFHAFLKFLHENKDKEPAKSFFEQTYPRVLTLSSAVEPYVRDILRVVSKEEADEESSQDEDESDYSKFFKKNPIVATGGLLLGAYAIVGGAKWLFGKLKKRHDSKVAAGEAEPGKGMFSAVNSGLDFMAKTLKFGFGFGVPLMVAGAFLGSEEVEAYLKKTDRAGIYKNRAVAALVHFVNGRGNEAVTTLAHGVRSNAERERHSHYADYFGIQEEHVWVMGNIPFTEFMQSDASRKGSLVTSRYANLPIVGSLFDNDEQLKAELKIRRAFTGKRITALHQELGSFEGKTLNEVLKVAFFDLSLFKLEEASDAEDVLNDDLGGTISGLEGDVDVFSNAMLSFRDKERLSGEEIDTLKKHFRQARGGLEDLRGAIPGRMAEFSEIAVRTFPSFIGEDSVKPADWVRARNVYDSLFREAQDAEMSLITEDLTVLDSEIKPFLASLRPNEPLTLSQKENLREYTKRMSDIYKNVRQALIRAKVDRRREINLDIQEGVTDKDVVEAAQLWFYGYKNLAFGIYFDGREAVQNLFGEGGSYAAGAFAIGGFVAKGAVVAEGVYGATMLLNPSLPMTRRALGAANILVPGIHVAFDAPPIAVQVAKVWRYSPARIMELLIRGRISREAAQKLILRALGAFDSIDQSVFAKTPGLADKVRVRKEMLNVFKDLLAQVSADDFTEMLKVARKEGAVQAMRFLEGKGYEAGFIKRLSNVIESDTGKSLSEFIENVAVRHSKYLSRLDSAKDIIFSSFNRFRLWSYSMSDRLGLQRIPLDKLKGMMPNARVMFESAKQLGWHAATALLVIHYLGYNAAFRRDKVDSFLIGLSSYLGGVASYKAASEVGARLGVQAALRSPGNVFLKGAVGLTMAVGVTVLGAKTAESAMDGLMRKNNALTFALRGSVDAASVASASSLFDIGFWSFEDDERAYFMQETVLIDPAHLFSGKGAYRKKMAFGLHKGREDWTPEQAIAHWNGDVRDKVKELEAEGDEAGAMVLRQRIIDDNWVNRKMLEYSSKKEKAKGKGEEIYNVIMDSDLADDLTVKEQGLVRSLLITDLADSWFGRDVDLEKVERYALVKDLLKHIDNANGSVYSGELVIFSAIKSDLQLDKDFYKTIGFYGQIVEATDEQIDSVQEAVYSEQMENLFSLFGVGNDELIIADEVLEDIDLGEETLLTEAA